MAPAPKDQTIRITALCIRRICLGYRNKNLIPAPPTQLDAFSASIVFATAFVFVCLMLMLLLVLVETIRVISISHIPLDLNKSFDNIAHIYTETVASCPPVFSSEPGTCAVCLEDYNTNTIGRKLPCNHFFHVACIDRWFLRSAGRRWPKDVIRCPVCKQAVSCHHEGIQIDEINTDEAFEEETPLLPESERQYQMQLAENMA